MRLGAGSDAVPGCHGGGGVDLAERGRHFARANRWLAFQRHGPAGPDGTPNTDDDATDPLAGAAWTCPESWTAFWRERGNDAATAGDWPEAMRARLLAGDVPGAAQATMEARSRMGFDAGSWRQQLRLAALVFKAADGHAFGPGAERYALFLRYGAAGPDGRPGTPDDSTDPLAALAKQP